MKNKTAVGQRIRDLRKRHKFSQAYIAQKLFISQAAYSLIENSQNGIVADHILKLSEIYDVTADFILKGDTLVVRMGPEQGFVPFISIKAQAGFLQDLNRGTHDEDYEWYRLPSSEPGVEEKLFEIEGRSMVPTIMPGEVVVCRRIETLEAHLDGSLVIVITDDTLYAKRLRLDPDPDYLLLEDDNPRMKSLRKMRKKDINQLLMIRGKISEVFTPYSNVESRDEKMQAMKDSIELLKKELNAMNNKLRDL